MPIHNPTEGTSEPPGVLTDHYKRFEVDSIQ